MFIRIIKGSLTDAPSSCSAIKGLFGASRVLIIISTCCTPRQALRERWRIGDPEEEEGICVPDTCPICRPICSTLPPVAGRSYAAMVMKTSESHLLVTGADIDVT